MVNRLSSFDLCEYYSVLEGSQSIVKLLLFLVFFFNQPEFFFDLLETFFYYPNAKICCVIYYRENLTTLVVIYLEIARDDFGINNRKIPFLFYHIF